MLGWRARIGLIVPATNTATEFELRPLLPEGVILCVARALSSREPDQVKRLSGYWDQALKAAREVAEVKPDLVVWACTSGSFVGGVGYDRRLAEAMEAEAKAPVVTTSTAVIEALQVLRVERIAMGTPYPQPVTDLEKRFFEDSVPGLRVVRDGIIDLSDPYSRGLIRPEEAYRLALRVDAPEAQAVFLSCTDLRTFPIVEAAEQALGKPVISSNLVTLWAAMRRLGLAPTRALGRLWQSAG